MTDPADDLPVAGTIVLLRPATSGVEVLLMRRPDRGSFASAWVFPGGKVEPGDRVLGAAEVDDARRAAIREVIEEVGLVVGEATVLSRWQPPASAPVRIRTWFFVAEPAQRDLRPAPDEVVETAWVSPAEALARHATGEWTLFPPTWVTLHGLSRHESAGDVIAAAGTAQLFTTQVVDEGFAWGEQRLETGSLPWRFTEG